MVKRIMGEEFFRLSADNKIFETYKNYSQHACFDSMLMLMISHFLHKKWHHNEYLKYCIWYWLIISIGTIRRLQIYLDTLFTLCILSKRNLIFLNLYLLIWEGFMDYYIYQTLHSQHSQGSKRFRFWMLHHSFNEQFLDPWFKYYNNHCEFSKESRACEKDCYSLGTVDCQEKCKTKEDCIKCMDDHAKCVSNCPCHSGCPDGCPCRHWTCIDGEIHDANQLLILRKFTIKHPFNSGVIKRETKEPNRFLRPSRSSNPSINFTELGIKVLPRGYRSFYNNHQFWLRWDLYC